MMNSTIRTNFSIPASIAHAVVQRHSENQQQRQAKVAKVV